MQRACCNVSKNISPLQAGEAIPASLARVTRFKARQRKQRRSARCSSMCNLPQSKHRRTLCDPRVSGVMRKSLSTIFAISLILRWRVHDRVTLSPLSALRRFGLDPRTQDPASGEEVVGIPLNASETDDDLLCPYDSLYASPPFGLLSPPLGCQATILPETASSFLQRESAITDRILQAGAALARDLPLIEKTVMNTLTSAALFVRDMGKLRPIPLPLLATPPALLPTSYTASGESGCLG